MKNKRGAEWWQLMLIILAVASLIVAIFIMMGVRDQTSGFLDWLKWMS